MTRDKPGGLAGEIGKRKPFTVPEQEAYLNLVRTADQLTAGFARLFKAHGISPAQYNVLRILRGHGTKVPTQRIAEEMITRDPDVTRLLDRLERAGMIKRQRGTRDRRVVWVALAPAGKQVLDKLAAPVRTLHRKQLGHLSRQSLQHLSRLLFESRHPPATE